MWPKYKTEAKARKHTWKWFVPCNISEWWAAFKLQCSGNTHRIGKMHSITCSGSTFIGREGDSWAFFKAEDKGLGPMWSRSSQSSPTHVSMFWIICWRHHLVTLLFWVTQRHFWIRSISMTFTVPELTCCLLIKDLGSSSFWLRRHIEEGNTGSLLHFFLIASWARTRLSPVTPNGQKFTLSLPPFP